MTELARSQSAKRRQVLERRQLNLVSAGLASAGGALILPG
jgi:hypothetical protein